MLIIDWSPCSCDFVLSWEIIIRQKLHLKWGWGLTMKAFERLTQKQERIDKKEKVL